MSAQPAGTSRRAVSEYRRSTDPFDEWYLDWCVTNDRGAMALSADLYASFKEFCEAGGIEKVMTNKSFGLKLAEKQHEKHKRNGNIWRVGIRLRTEAERMAADRAQEAEDAGSGIGAGVVDDSAFGGADDDMPEGW